MCLSIRPVVDRLERDLKGLVLVFRVEIRSQAGAALAERYGVRSVPTFVLYDGQGRERWRREGRPPDRRRLFRELSAPR